MAKKLKLNFSGLKTQVKKGIITIDYLDGKVDFPILIKDDRTYKRIIALSDHKYKTALENDKLVPTRLEKVTSLNRELRDMIYNSEGYSSSDNGFVKVYNESELQVALVDRVSMVEGITVVAHIDMEFVVDEKKNITFTDLINETFKDLIESKYNGELLKVGDYYKLTEILYEVNLLSREVISEFAIQLRAMKYGTEVETERYRSEAIELGMSDIEGYIELRKNANKLKETVSTTIEDDKEEVETEEIKEKE